jgi:uncharacterized membrane protein YvbJ
MPDNASFCTNCGAKAQNSQPVVNQNVNAANIDQNNMNQPYSNQPYQNQPYQNQPYTGQPYGNGPAMGMARPKSKAPLFVGIGAAAIVVLLVLVFLLKSVFGGGTNSSPENVVKAFFKAVSSQDVDLLKKTIYMEEEEDLLSGFDAFSVGMLKMIDASLDDELGNDWHKKIKVKEVETSKEDGETTVDVDITMGEEEDSIKVIKKGSKYYVSPDELY